MKFDGIINFVDRCQFDNLNYMFIHNLTQNLLHGSVEEQFKLRDERESIYNFMKKNCNKLQHLKVLILIPKDAFMCHEFMIRRHNGIDDKQPSEYIIAQKIVFEHFYDIFKDVFQIIKIEIDHEDPKRSINLVVDRLKEECMVETKPTLKFVRALPGANAPTKGSEFSAGYDLKSLYKYVVPKGGKTLINTGL